MKAPNDYLGPESDVDRLRRTRHQRDARLGRLVRVPFHVVFPKFVRPETVEPHWEPRKDIVCAIICWVPEDHYLVALPSRCDGTACGTTLGRTSTVPCGVCVDA
jgi:hypothetical protein